jgi:hypothetical protein
MYGMKSWGERIIVDKREAMIKETKTKEKVQAQ